jgi:hypothetical protein
MHFERACHFFFKHMTGHYTQLGPYTGALPEFSALGRHLILVMPMSAGLTYHLADQFLSEQLCMNRLNT